MNRRILYILHRFPVPSERFLARELACLDADWKLEPKALKKERGFIDALRTDKDFIGLSEQVEELPGPFSPGIILANARLSLVSPRKYFARIASTISRFFIKNPGHAAAVLRAAWLAKKAEKNGVNLIHASFAGIPTTLAWAVHRLSGIPYTVAVHARDVFVDSPCIELKLKEAAAVIACNRAAAEAAVERGIPPDKVSVVHHPLPERYLSLPDAEECFSGTVRDGESPFRFLYAGRLVEKKGVRLLADAFRAAVEGGADIVLEVAGDGPDAVFFKRLPDAIRRRIVLRGWLREADYIESLQRADALLLPAVTAADRDRDGIPNVVIEAFAAGTPVIAGGAGGLAEIFGDNRLGRLLDGGNPAEIQRSLAECLAKFSHIREVLYENAVRAQDYVRRKFTCEKTKLGYNKVWNKILEEFSP